MQVLGRRLSERDSIEGSAIDIIERSNKNSAMLSAKSSLQQEERAVTNSRELITSLAVVARESIDIAVGKAMQ